MEPLHTEIKQSSSITKLAVALHEFHSELDPIKKDSVNPYYRSTYATLSAILKVVDPLLNKQGLSVLQLPVGKNGLWTRLLHISGEYIEGTCVMHIAAKPHKEKDKDQDQGPQVPKEISPQDAGSAITYMRRYMLSALLSLNVDVDDDGNAASKLREMESNTPPKKQYDNKYGYGNKYNKNSPPKPTASTAKAVVAQPVAQAANQGEDTLKEIVALLKTAPSMEDLTEVWRETCTKFRSNQSLLAQLIVTKNARRAELNAKKAA